MTDVILRRRKLGRGSTRGIAAACVANLGVVRSWVDSFPADTRLVFRWGCTSNVPDGATVVNSAKSIHWCSDKRQGRLDMQAAGVPVPKTFDPRIILASFGDGHEGDFGEAAAEAGLDKEYVLRPRHHSQGCNILYGTLASIDDNLNQLYQGARRLYDEFLDGYLSYKIDKVAEYRVMVVCNRVVWVAQKTPGNPDQVAWNVAQGGRFDNVRWDSWPMAVVKAALKAAKVSGCDFCGVDVMVDAEGNPFVLEINSAPSQTSPYRQRCVAKAFDHIVSAGEACHFDDVADGPRRTYKSYIHPAVRENHG